MFGHQSPRSTRPPLYAIYTLLLATTILATSSPAGDAPLPTSELIKDLGSANVETRRLAAYDLHHHPNHDVLEPAVPALIKALSDADPQVYFHCIATIARIGPKAHEAIPALVELINNRQRRGVLPNQIHYRTAYALGRIGKASVPELLKLADSGNATTRNTAYLAMSWIGTKHQAVIPRLIQGLGDSDDAARERAIESLAVIGEPAVNPLSAVLAGESKQQRLAAAKVLGRMGSSAGSASDSLLKALKDADTETQIAALEALGGMLVDPAKLAPHILQALRTSDDQLRAVAISVVQRSDRKLKSTLASKVIQLIQSEDASTSQAAARVAVYLGTSARQAIPHLINAMAKTSDSNTGDAYAQALGSIGMPAFESIINALKQPRIPIPPLVHALAGIGDPAIQDLQSGLNSDHARVREGCAMALGELGRSAKNAIPSLTAATDDSAAGVRAASIGALAAIAVGDAINPEVFKKGLADKDNSVRTAAAKAVSVLELEEPKLNALLAIAIHDARSSVRKPAAMRLVRSENVPDSIIPDCVAMLSDPDAEVRLASTRILTNLGSRAVSSVPALTKSLNDPDTNVRANAILALAKMESAAEPAVDQLIQAVGSDESVIVLNAVNALGAIGTKAWRASSTIRKRLDDNTDTVRQAAVANLIRIAPPDQFRTLVPTIEGVLNDERHWLVRREAIRVSGQLGGVAKPVVPVLFKELKQSVNRRYAVTSLNQIKSTDASHLSAIVNALSYDDNDARIIAANYLGQLGNAAKSAAPELQELTKHNDAKVRSAAESALKRIR